MRLTEFDEFPFHQHPTPFNIPFTSDVHFNDGYFCAAFAEDWYVVSGMRLHPNMNVLDGFAGIARNGMQRVLRASRALQPNSSELSVGPLRFDIRAPMREVVVSLVGNEANFSFELTFRAKATPFLETPYQFRKYGHLIHDLVRYTQVCVANGNVVLDGKATEVTDWHAIRDHSWGVRSGMGPATPHGGVGRDKDEIDRRRFRIWAPFSLDRYTGFFNTHEDEEGNPLDFEGSLTMPDGKQVELTAVRHCLQHAPGTKNVIGGTFALCDNEGGWRDYQLRARHSSRRAGARLLWRLVGWWERWRISRRRPDCGDRLLPFQRRTRQNGLTVAAGGKAAWTYRVSLLSYRSGWRKRHGTFRATCIWPI